MFLSAIAAYAIALNDIMPDDLRQELLMPFVTRLAGTVDAQKIEVARIKLIALRTIRDILPISLRASGLHEHAERCETLKDFANAANAADDAANAANAARYAANAANAATNAAYADRSAAYAAYAADDATNAANATRYAANCAANAADANAADAAANTSKVFTIAASILDEAIRLGKQAEPIETALVVGRMEKMKQRPLATTS